MTADAFDGFSYADPGDPPLKRHVIRLIERMTGQPHLRRLYQEYRATPQRESFWDEAVRRLRLTLAYDAAPLAFWPRNGPLVVVCNHPFGVIDGVAICHMVSRLRGDFRILTHALLNRAEEIRTHLLPVDFSETPAARATNLKSRADAKAHLQAGGCLIVFPAGGVSTTPGLLHRRATDAAWKTLTARLIQQAQAPVAPVYFHGQNSRLFQVASHLHQTLRLSLLFKEVHDRIGSEVRMTIGAPIPYAQLAGFQDRQMLMAYLRNVTYGLGTAAGDVS